MLPRETGARCLGDPWAAERGSLIEAMFDLPTPQRPLPYETPFTPSDGGHDPV